ncbi:MAG: histidinol-phosphate transaminase [Lachnospiraceae bacterium]|nr:histidinol-phosphate transaminase [Lachnospiraceae bacterium]
MPYSWKEKVRFIEPYIPGEQPESRVIKLNTNENPYPPAPCVIKAIREFDLESLRFYPSAESDPLREAFAKYYSLDKDNIFIANGSDDVLALSFLSFFYSDLPVFFPDVTYSFYKVWCALFNIPFELKELSADFKINVTDYYGENGGVVIANPNAPTAIPLNLAEVEDIVSHNLSSVVILDEAYAGFGCESAMGLIKKYDNLLIVQTFSKSRSLAGMRIGAAFGNKELIAVLSAVKNSYNSYPVNKLSQAAAEASLNDAAYFAETTAKVIKTRTFAAEELKKLGFTVTESETNFLFAEHEKISASSIKNYLESKNIYVRFFNAPRINNHLRITIGTDEEMEALIRELKSFLP